MAYSWKILRGAVEQEILFPSEKCYEAYLEQLIRKEEPFEIVDEQENEDGTYTVVMRKRYNNNEFLRNTEDTKKLRERIMAEARKMENNFRSVMDVADPRPNVEVE